MLQTLARPVAATLAPPAPARPLPGRQADLPTLRLRQVPIDDTPATGRCLSLDAWPGELVHLGGGSMAQRHQVLRLAAGLGRPLAGRCEMLGRDAAHAVGHAVGQAVGHAVGQAVGHAVGQTGGGTGPAWSPAMLGHVLHDDSLPARLSVPDFVAEPLLTEGLDRAEARTRAELELYLLGAAGLRQRRPESLGLLQARQVRLARATVTRPALLVLAWPDRGLDADAARALRLALTTLACTFGSCVLLTSDDPRLKASADRHIDLDRLA